MSLPGAALAHRVGGLPSIPNTFPTTHPFPLTRLLPISRHQRPLGAGDCDILVGRDHDCGPVLSQEEQDAAGGDDAAGAEEGQGGGGGEEEEEEGGGGDDASGEKPTMTKEDVWGDDSDDEEADKAKAKDDDDARYDVTTNKPICLVMTGLTAYPLGAAGQAGLSPATTGVSLLACRSPSSPYPLKRARRTHACACGELRNVGVPTLPTY